MPWLALIAVLAVSDPGNGMPAPEPVRTPDAGTTAPQPGASLRASVHALLDSGDPSEREEAWRALGPDALDALVRIATEPRSALRTRERAVDAMPLLQSPDAGVALRKLLETPRFPAPVRAAAAVALGRHDGRGAVQALRPLLYERVTSVRDAAARALATVGGEEARAALEEALAETTDRNAREVFQRQLSRMQL